MVLFKNKISPKLEKYSFGTHFDVIWEALWCTEASEKPTQKRGRKKSTQIQLWIAFFRKSCRPAAKMAPGRHPKVDPKSIKKHPFSNICISTILDTHFSVPKGSGGTPFAAKTQNFGKKPIKTHTNKHSERKPRKKKWR